MKNTSPEQYYPLPPWTLLICTPVIIWPNLKISDMIWQIVWSRLADHYLCSSRDRADLYLRVNLFLRRKCGILSNVWTWWGPSFSIYSINYRRLADFTFVRTFVHNHHWSWHGLALTGVRPVNPGEWRQCQAGWRHAGVAGWDVNRRKWGPCTQCPPCFSFRTSSSA